MAGKRIAKTYGRIRMHQALNLKNPEGVLVPSERTVYRVMEEMCISHRPKRKPSCESMWARLKDELIYGRYDASKITVEEMKTLIWRYFISYWNNRRICSANGGLLYAINKRPQVWKRRNGKYVVYYILA